MNWSAWGVETNKGELREAHLLITAQAADDEPRAPVMVNLVLDRSGSMKGAPLSAAIEAALQFVDLARPDDYLGLVLVDGVAEQRVPVSAMDGRGKRAMHEALASVHTGQGTALYQAIDLAAKGLQRILVPGRRPRLFVLTDGEPSVGPDSQDDFNELGLRIAKSNISVHALGLARHYVAEVLEAITQPSGNAYEHVDGPEGLSEAMGAVLAHLFGQVASDAKIRVQPEGFAALSCRHGFPAALDGDALVVTLGEIARGFVRRVLLSGTILPGAFGAVMRGTAVERGDTRHQTVELERVTADSARGRLILGINHELDLVSAETSAWLSLARKETQRAEIQLSQAEISLRNMVSLAPEGLAIRRHLERLGDLRMAIERGEGDIPLLIRRAQSARAGTAVSQVIPLQAYRNRRA